MRAWRFSACLCLWAGTAFAFSDSAQQVFTEQIRPVLVQNCSACHNPANPKNRVDFLKGETAQDIETRRGLWRDVATQLRNRTMPPMATKLTEPQRLEIATWVETRLRETACSTGPFAGAPPARRLNRREYHNTMRDLLGVELAVSDLFPADESGGAGFDTNAETLFIPPVMLERYMDAAQKTLDRVIITPPMSKVFPSAEMQPPKPSPKPGRTLTPQEAVTATLPIYLEASYNLRVSIERPAEMPVRVELKVDGNPVGGLTYGKDPNGGPTARAQAVTLTRGPHTITVAAKDQQILLYEFAVEQRQPEIPAEKRALHYRLFGLEPGEAPLEPRRAAQQLLTSFLPKAYRLPVDQAEIDRFLTLYDRAAERGDPYEERIKLMLKAVLVSPKFLFRVEDIPTKPGIQPLGQYELASRLSYFLWSTMPDEELLRLAREGRLQDTAVLTAQVERMLNDPRSRSFASSFVGQWLGTQDVGGRVVPILTELQHYYTPEVAADLRTEPVLLFSYLLGENRSLLELLTANYSFLNERLVKFYQLDGQVKNVQGSAFQKVEWPDNRRAGVLGMASVLAMTSHYKQSSPVLRGAWVLDTLLGTPVPPPPPDVPALDTSSKSERGMTMRQSLLRHRADPACQTCHQLMDPVGFGLENFDWMGRWHDQEPNGQPIDASGVLPSGERFSGPVELRQILLGRKDEFLRHLTSKVLGYALGRSLQDGDQCVVQRLVDTLAKHDYRTRTLVREIVLSQPFRQIERRAAVTTASPASPITKRQRVHPLGDK